MAKYLFYPGCSLERNERSYLDSLLAISKIIDVEFEEIHDWNCCGATEYMSVHHLAAHALIARNLALAAQQTDGPQTVMAACSACYLNLAKTDSYMRRDPQMAEQVNTALGAGDLHYTPGTLRIRHLLDIIVNDVGLEKVRSKVVRPLKGLRIAPYYGCMIARPDRDHRWDDVEYPVALDGLMHALGAEVVDFPLKTHCCGGHMTQINVPVAYELIRQLVYGADRYHADALVVLCPMCQLNLDAYQAEVNRYFHTNYQVPVIFFTQLMGVAFGLEPKVLGFGREFVDARPVLNRIGVEPPTEVESTSAGARRAQTKREKQALPMPRMPEEEEKEEVIP